MLEGKSVGLRLLETDDAWLLYRWFNDQRVLEDLGAEHLYFASRWRRRSRSRSNGQRQRGNLVHRPRARGRSRSASSGWPRSTDATPRPSCRIVIGEAGAWDRARHRGDQHRARPGFHGEEPSSDLAARRGVQRARDRLLQEVRIQPRGQSEARPLPQRRLEGRLAHEHPGGRVQGERDARR